MQKRPWPQLLLALLMLAACTTMPTGTVVLEQASDLRTGMQWYREIQWARAGDIPSAGLAALNITEPFKDALFPPEIAAPIFLWKDSSPRATRWLLRFTFTGTSVVLYTGATTPEWEPSAKIWETIKKHSLLSTATLTVWGLENGSQTVVSKGDTRFSTSNDPVNASILYRQVPLPFTTKYEKIQWRLGDIASYGAPKTVMQNIPVCASCHTVSRDGKFLSMEMNYGGDGGAQFITPVRKRINLTRDDFFSWNRYPRSGIVPKSRGLFGRMSPSGRYAVASVNEISLALITREAEFSQVFFPTYGILAVYSVAEDTIQPLTGADNYDFVQANPNWHPTEKAIVFARAATKNEVHDNLMDVSPKYKDESIHELNKRYNIQFDLYTVPFNEGRGGTPQPLKGASQNGMSNYFARYSPDGKWIVFTQSRTGIMLQPDAALYIVPATGGKARRMTCNREKFNSWHSWSPNGKWLLFSSKANSPYTEIYLTHVDKEGHDTPPVRLSRLSDPKLAANVPEFVNIPTDAIERISVR